MKDFEVDFKSYSPDEFEMHAESGNCTFGITSSVVAFHKESENLVRSHIGKSQLENRYYAMTALIFMLELNKNKQ